MSSDQKPENFGHPDPVPQPQQPQLDSPALAASRMSRRMSKKQTVEQRVPMFAPAKIPDEKTTDTPLQSTPDNVIGNIFLSLQREEMRKKAEQAKLASPPTLGLKDLAPIVFLGAGIGLLIGYGIAKYSSNSEVNTSGDSASY